MAQVTKVQKLVTVLFVYRFKHVARICFEVLSSNGTDKYHTCFDTSSGQLRESCNCPSKGGCYHRDQLRARAQAYFQSKQQGLPAAKPVETVPVIAVMEAAHEAMVQFDRDTDPNAYDVLATTKTTVAEREARGLAESYDASWYPKSQRA